MSNFDTAKAIIENIKEVLRAQGINFTEATFGDTDDIPASLIPYGRIFYEREIFEYTHGQKPLYAETEFRINVILRDTNQEVLIRDQQEWVHKIRDSVTINALNINDLASSLLVSRVTSDNVEMENFLDVVFIDYRMLIRYREL